MKNQTLTQDESSELTAITIDESNDFIRLESVIKNGINTWIEVGNALLEIRDRKLYRIEHSTFEEYCRSKWNMQRAQAYRIMAGAEAVNDLSPIGDISESVAREIAKAPEELRDLFYRTALESAGGQPPTAKQVETVVSRYMVPKIVEALSVEEKVIRFFHPESRNMGEFVPSTRGYWFVWWAEVNADGRIYDTQGCRKEASLAVAWHFLSFSEKQIAWKDSEFHTFDSSIFGHFEPGAPWDYNAALFESYEQYLELGLGIRKSAK